MSRSMTEPLQLAGDRAVPSVQIRRSARRRRTVSAFRERDRIVVQVPARLSAAEEARLVQRMVDRLTAPSPRSNDKGDAALARRAFELSQAYLDGRVAPTRIRWVPAMRTRWASCTPSTRSIRVSERLRDFPDWVRDYVLVHELAHLLIAGHTAAFWALVGRYPRTERARGFLDGVSAAASLGFADDLADDVDEPVAADS